MAVSAFTLVAKRAITSGGNQTAETAVSAFTLVAKRTITSGGNQTAEMAVTAFTAVRQKIHHLRLEPDS
jgi:hypothetical protein